MISEKKNLAAIICNRCANGAPILRCVRDESVSDEDSGWQFHCGDTHSDGEGGEVWLLAEVVEVEPSLVDFLNFPVGTTLTRADSLEKWTVLRS